MPTAYVVNEPPLIRLTDNEPQQHLPNYTCTPMAYQYVNLLVGMNNKREDGQEDHSDL